MPGGGGISGTISSTSSRNLVMSSPTVSGLPVTRRTALFLSVLQCSARRLRSSTKWSAFKPQFRMCQTAAGVVPSSRCVTVSSKSAPHSPTPHTGSKSDPPPPVPPCLATCPTFFRCSGARPGTDSHISGKGPSCAAGRNGPLPVCRIVDDAASNTHNARRSPALVRAGRTRTCAVLSVSQAAALFLPAPSWNST